ncbi:MAG: tetratricopeptide repeat protein [bacterium]
MTLLVALALSLPAWCAEQNTVLARGINLFYQGKWDGAIDSFNEEIKNNPQDTIAYNFLLDALFRRGTLESYSNELEGRLQDKPDDPLLRTQLGLVYFARSKSEPAMLDEALEELKKAANGDPQSSLAYSGLGMVYFDKRMMPKAKNHFSKAMQLNPTDILALELLGNIILVDEKKPADALALFQKIVEICPVYPDAYYYVGSADFDLGKDDESVAALKKAMELDPDGLTQSYYAPILLGDLYFRKKMYPEALQAYQTALKINNKNDYVRYKIEKIQHPDAETAPAKTDETLKAAPAETSSPVPAATPAGTPSPAPTVAPTVAPAGTPSPAPSAAPARKIPQKTVKITKPKKP